MTSQELFRCRNQSMLCDGTLVRLKRLKLQDIVGGFQLTPTRATRATRPSRAVKSKALQRYTTFLPLRDLASVAIDGRFAYESATSVPFLACLAFHALGAAAKRIPIDQSTRCAGKASTQTPSLPLARKTPSLHDGFAAFVPVLERHRLRLCGLRNLPGALQNGKYVVKIDRAQ